LQKLQLQLVRDIEDLSAGVPSSGHWEISGQLLWQWLPGIRFDLKAAE